MTRSPYPSPFEPVCPACNGTGVAPLSHGTQADDVARRGRGLTHIAALVEDLREQAEQRITTGRWSFSYIASTHELLMRAADAIERLAAELRAEGEMEWMPISTAPKGVDILIYVPNGKHQFVAKWDPRMEDWCYAEGEWTGNWWRPTHWMPLPSPPEKEGAS